MDLFLTAVQMYYGVKPGVNLLQSNYVVHPHAHSQKRLCGTVFKRRHTN